MRNNTWTVINFGKFKNKGMTLPQIVFTDPDWFFFAVEEERFMGKLAWEAADIAAKAKKIRIPGKSAKRWKVRYYFSREGSFERFEVVKASTDNWYPSAGGLEISDFLDLSITRKRKHYDKKGGKRLIKGLKFCLYGRTNVRLTKKVCERFFDDPSNFG